MKRLVVISLFCIVLSLIISFCSILYVNNNQINKKDIENTINNALSNYNTNQHISDKDIDRIVEKVVDKLETSQTNEEVLDKLDEVLSNENSVSNFYYDFVTNNNSYIETINTI